MGVLVVLVGGVLGDTDVDGKSSQRMGGGVDGVDGVLVADALSLWLRNARAEWARERLLLLDVCGINVDTMSRR